MSEHHHLSSRGILRSRVRSSVAAVLGVALAGVGATPGAPQPPPPRGAGAAPPPGGLSVPHRGAAGTG